MQVRLLAVTGMLAMGGVACSGTPAATTEPLLATTPPPNSSTAPGSTGVPATAAVPLVPAGCAAFDGTELGELSPLQQPLDLIQESSGAGSLVCNFIGVADGLDTGVRIEVDLLVDHPEGHFVTPGQVESPVQIAGLAGVGSGRGNLRLQLDDTRGLTLAVTIRALSSKATLPRDREYLDLRDAIAAYLVGRLI